MLSSLRWAYNAALTPLARFLLWLGFSPTTLTVTGALGVTVGALGLLPTNQLLLGAGVVATFLLCDGLDGTMARLAGRESRFGAFLDSTLDRVADAAVFTGLALWGANRPGWLMPAALACLVTSFLVSYARARAEAEGWQASQGPFERTERLLLTLLGTAAVGLGAPEWVLGAALWIVACGSALTAARRVAAAWRAD